MCRGKSGQFGGHENREPSKEARAAIQRARRRNSRHPNVYEAWEASLCWQPWLGLVASLVIFWRSLVRGPPPRHNLRRQLLVVGCRAPPKHCGFLLAVIAVVGIRSRVRVGPAHRGLPAAPEQAAAVGGGAPAGLAP